MYIQSLHLGNYKCFENAGMNFFSSSASDLKNNHTLIVGDNRSGKSVILKAIAMNSIGPVILGSGFRPIYLSRISISNSGQNGEFSSEGGFIRGKHFLTSNEQEITNKESEKFARFLLQTRDIKIGMGKEFQYFEFKNGFRPNKTTSQEEISFHLINPIETADPSVFSKLTTGNAKDIFETARDLFSFGEFIGNSDLFGDTSPHCFVAGYHPSRRIELAEWNAAAMNRQRGIRYQRVAGLFEEQVSLRPLTGWFQTLSKQRQQEVEHLLASLLGGKPIRLTEAPQRDI